MAGILGTGWDIPRKRGPGPASSTSQLSDHYRDVLQALAASPDGLTSASFDAISAAHSARHLTRPEARVRALMALRRLQEAGHVRRAGTMPTRGADTVLWEITEAGRARLAQGN